MAGIFTRLAVGLRACGDRFIVQFVSTNVYETVVIDDGQPLPPARCRLNKGLRKLRDAHTQKQQQQLGGDQSIALQTTGAIPT